MVAWQDRSRAELQQWKNEGFALSFLQSCNPAFLQ
jgi:hypothetical protein